MLHVEERGRGSPVILLHDTPCRPEHMRRLGDRLAGRFRVLLVHRPGYGRSAPLDPYSLQRAQTSLEDMLVERRIRDAHYIGFGVGAYLALSLACRTSVRARSVACLGGSGSFDVDQKERFAAWATMLRTGSDLRQLVEDVVLSPRGRENIEASSDVHRWVDVQPDNLARELEALLRAPDLDAGIARLCAPILVRVGSIDAMCPPEVARRIVADARYVTFEEIPGLGHALLWEDLEATCASVERHLKNAEQFHAPVRRA